MSAFLQVFSQRRQFEVLVAAMCISIWMTNSPSAFAFRGVSEESDSARSISDVEQLVRQLGSDHYIRREQARNRLLSMGQDAFDSLYVAISDADAEIRLQAESLMRSLEIVLVRSSDSDVIKREIARYENASPAARLDILDQLAAMPNDAGRSAICRIARFESSEFLSKKAALAFFETARPFNASRVATLSSLIDDELQNSQRPSADWLRAYLAYLQFGESSLSKWRELQESEEQVYRDNPSQSQKQLINQLLHWHVQILDELGRRGESIATIKRVMKLLIDKPSDIVEQLDWLTEHEAWSVIDEIVTGNQETISSNALMSYQLARTYRLRGDPQRAAEASGKAFEMSEDPKMRFIIGQELRKRTELDWFEREYRAAIEDERSGLAEILDAQIQLVDVKLDWQQYADCISLIDETLAKAKTDEELHKRFTESSWLSHLQSVRSIAESRICEEAGNESQQRELLETALRQEPENIDILIELYRLPGNTKAFQEKIEDKVKETTRDFQLQIDQASAAFRRQAFGSYRVNLEMFYNQYAWLVSNTFGNYELALEYSKKSLELRPNSPDYLDTLARCYFALGDYETAMIHQRQASRLKPYLGQVKRQMDLFEKIYKEKVNENLSAKQRTAR